MKIACIAFTKSGEEIASKIKDGLSHKTDIYTKANTTESFKELCIKIFQNYEGIIFVSSTGIAVRFIAPLIKDKTKDPAVVVVDDLGRYSISLLSGHIGGANRLAEEVAQAIKAQPIITTASDGRGIDAVDTFAIRNGFMIEDMKDAKTITAMMVEGRPISLITEIKCNINYNNLTDENPDGAIIISSSHNVNYDKPYCILRPKNLNLGIGCKKGKSKEEIFELIQSGFLENNLSLKSIKSIGTNELKKDEQGIIEVCKKLNCSMEIFKNQDVEKVQNMFKSSNFVQSNVGVTSVAEPCAYLLGGEMIVMRNALNGVTVAVSREV